MLLAGWQAGWPGWLAGWPIGNKSPAGGPNSILSHAPGWLAGWLAWLAGGQLARVLAGLVDQPWALTAGWLAWLAGGSASRLAGWQAGWLAGRLAGSAGQRKLGE